MCQSFPLPPPLLRPSASAYAKCFGGQVGGRVAQKAGKPSARGVYFLAKQKPREESTGFCKGHLLI